MAGSGKISIKLGTGKPGRRRQPSSNLGLQPIQSRQPVADDTALRHVNLKLKDIREFLLEQRLARNKGFFTLVDIDNKVRLSPPLQLGCCTLRCA